MNYLKQFNFRALNHVIEHDIYRSPRVAFKVLKCVLKLYWQCFCIAPCLECFNSCCFLHVWMFTVFSMSQSTSIQATKYTCKSTVCGFHSRPIYDVSWGRHGYIATAAGDNAIRVFEQQGASLLLAHLQLDAHSGLYYQT